MPCIADVPAKRLRLLLASHNTRQQHPVQEMFLCDAVRCVLAQALGEMGVPSAMSHLVKAAAFKALYLQRDSNPYALSVYLHSAISAFFLRSREGQAQLRAADLASKAVLEAALETHRESPVGATAAYGWTLIRKLNPAAPAQLHLWGEEKHSPPAESCSAALQNYIASHVIVMHISDPCTDRHHVYQDFSRPAGVSV